jgi:uncharacterized protein (DUF2236 family)
MASVLPAPEELATLVPRRDGPVWRAASDVRMLSTSGYALLLQVAHPTVGAGVGEHSNFAQDPWGRLLRTLDYVHGSIYGGPELAGEIGRRVRAMHKGIKGLKPDGERYHALEPTAYAWVHATLASALVDGHRVFADEMTPAQAEAFWEEWLDVGRLIGVRPRDLPERWAQFPDYFHAMIADELEDNPTVHEVLATLAEPAPPAIPGVPPRVWTAIRRPLSAQLRLTTVGMLPPLLRHKLDLPWSRNDAAAFRIAAAASRAGSPAIRGPLREFGPHYVRWRRAALTRGDVARQRPAAAPACRPAAVA